jgi:3'(2'), 5'-bisphosphate nucleotidase
MDATELAALRLPLVALARQAAATIMEIYGGSFAVRTKSDRTPLTEADERSETVIAAGLAALTPGVAIVGEELQGRGELDWPQPAPKCFWLVDPLDGTREFVERSGQFAVSIGLVVAGRPAIGVVMTPVPGIVWSGGPAVGAFRQVGTGDEHPVRARPKPAKGLVLVTSKSHSSGAEVAYASAHRIAEHRKVGSAAKMGLIAEGSADLYPRLGPTSEWDTCGGEAIVTAAGGRVETLDGKPLVYGKPGFRNPDFVARGAW